MLLSGHTVAQFIHSSVVKLQVNQQYPSNTYYMTINECQQNVF